ncbi:MAG: GNAT family N-acetyltransferase [Thermoplasmatales archaeon]|nr:GNAT family N-acetyltransferase [Thermoplasmatales archaeon]MCW6169790.1 GNAT family N-acetyltransferase [Thermoplasmatales archaeon]
MVSPVIARGKKVFLCIIDKNDIPIIYETINDREVRRFLRDPDGINYLDGEFKWYENLVDHSESDRVFEIRSVQNDEFIGLIGLHKIDWKNGNAYVGYMSRKQFWGKGYMTEAVSLIDDYAFNDMGMRKLISSVFEPNVASIKVLQKNGFKQSGIFREVRLLRDYGYVNEIHFDLLKKEWEVMKKVEAEEK